MRKSQVCHFDSTFGLIDQAKLLRYIEALLLRHGISGSLNLPQEMSGWSFELDNKSL